MATEDQADTKTMFSQEFSPPRQHRLLKQILKDVKSKKELIVLVELFRPKFFEDL